MPLLRLIQRALHPRPNDWKVEWNQGPQHFLNWIAELPADDTLLVNADMFATLHASGQDSLPPLIASGYLHKVLQSIAIRRNQGKELEVHDAGKVGIVGDPVPPTVYHHVSFTSPKGGAKVFYTIHNELKG